MSENINELVDLEIIKRVTDINDIQRGIPLRRVSPSRDQHGIFSGLDDKSGLILLNVIDVRTAEYIADGGVVRPGREDTLYSFTGKFSKSRESEGAMGILLSWPIYRKNPELQSQMETFFRSLFTPDYLLYLKKTESLDLVFVPMQQKLKIGRYIAITDWDSLRKERFHEQLTGLKGGEHLTYIALIPQSSSYSPKFYSIGSKPHEETQMVLRTEGFNFKPTHGGHIRAEKREKETVYYVDAGSNFLGKGVKTKLETAKNIVKALQREYRDYTFIPIEGRGAFGTEQSY